MFGYGSKLGGAVVLAVAVAAGFTASLLASSPDHARWALFLAAALILCALLGRVLTRAAGPTPAAHPHPTPMTLEPGQIVPWDAVIQEGESEIDEGALGGPVFAQRRAPGDRLRQGARNGDGRLWIAPADKAATNPPAAQAGFDALFSDTLNRQSPRILLALVVLAAATAIQIDAATACLVVAAAVPPSLGLIRALVFQVARAKARKLGMAWRDAAALDRLASIDTVALAPGGILTRSELTMLSLHPAPGMKPTEVIAAAGTCCQSSQSSIARAILRFAVAHAVRLRSIGEWRPGPEQGSTAMTDLGAELALGGRGWLETRGLSPAAFDAVELPANVPGRRIIWIAELAPHMNLIGALTLGDRLKPGAAELAKNLKRIGIDTVLLEAGATEGQIDLARQLKLGRALPDRGAKGLLLVDRPGAAPGVSGPQPRAEARLRFGVTQPSNLETAAEIRREDPRAILDLIRLARATRRREAIATLLAFAFCLPGLWFALGARAGFERVAVEIATISPLLGLGAVIVSAQFLHLFQSTASEVDDE